MEHVRDDPLPFQMREEREEMREEKAGMKRDEIKWTNHMDNK